MQLHISRQPIFDRQQNVFAYDLLTQTVSRSLGQKSSTSLEDEKAEPFSEPNSLLIPHLSELTRGKRAFINVRIESLMNDELSLLPKGAAVISLPRFMKANDEILDACRRLKRAGFMLSTNGLRINDSEETAILEVVDFIKINVPSVNSVEQARLKDHLSRLGVMIIGDKLETRDLFQDAIKAGCSFFQGSFFSKPDIIAGKDIPANIIHYLKVLKEVQQEEINFLKIEELIKKDTGLTYKLLRYVNAAARARQSEIRSIKAALNLLGEKEVKRWSALIALTAMTANKPKELLTQAVTRARFCELLAPHAKLATQADELFLMGMFSLVDAILDMPLAKVLADLPLSDDIKSALQNEQSQFSQIYDFVRTYERGDWDQVSAQAATLDIDETQLSDIYLATINWANHQLSDASLSS